MISFLEAIASRILLFDGAMGTEIQRLNPQATDFPGNQDGFNDGLILTNPDWIKQIHRSYLKVGADCIETNTFGSNYLKLAEYSFGDNTLEFNKKAVDIARESISAFAGESLFLQCDLMELPFPAQTFDLVYSEGVLHHTPSTEAAIAKTGACLHSAC